MKTYYLVKESAHSNLNLIYVTDNANGRKVLESFKAESYAAAIKKYGYIVSSKGKDAYCGADKDGNVFAKVIE